MAEGPRGSAARFSGWQAGEAGNVDDEAGAPSRRRAVLAETPLGPRARPGRGFDALQAVIQTQRATPFGAALCVCWWSRRESNPRPQVFYVTDLHA